MVQYSRCAVLAACAHLEHPGGEADGAAAEPDDRLVEEVLRIYISENSQRHEIKRVIEKQTKQGETAEATKREGETEKTGVATSKYLECFHAGWCLPNPTSTPITQKKTVFSTLARPLQPANGTVLVYSFVANMRQAVHADHCQVCPQRPPSKLL